MIVRLHDDVDQELEEAFDFYEGRRRGLGAEFLEEFVRGTRQIAAAPVRWPRDRSRPDVRRYRLHRFPYVLVYQIRNDHALIVAVMHGSRRPGYWRDRLN